MSDLNMLSQVLLDIEKTFGSDACLAACEIVYSSQYKDNSTFTVIDCPDLKDEMIAMTAEYLAIKAGVYTPVQFSNDIPYDEYHDQYDDRESIEQFIETATALVMNNLEFVNLCNYKGEGEGYTLMEQAKQLRTFIGKYNYI